MHIFASILFRLNYENIVSEINHDFLRCSSFIVELRICYR